ncbi:phage tail protein [Ectopseudomonas hydrolytica]|uniref:Phage tail protein n=1 Tax=Ectopseudomonas hydrolytica TaxID=2493633 RepID=A0ABY5A8G8_9GAMM|nr:MULTISPECIES: phage tail protein [Pseudomonas]MDH0095847.1 phage tail protein [Pseudomonas sp. GD04158]USR40005.1 phage tail protein [Pseudomonas hydrolytica]
MGAKPKAQTVGFRYSFDIHGAIAKAIDGLLQIRASGKVAWSGNATTSQTITINAPDLFGGDKGEGGIQGRFDLMMGDEAQPLNASLAAALGGGHVPNFRGFAGFFYSGLVTSINPYPKPWELLRYRRMNGWDGDVWYPETCAINLAGGQVRAMNPAHILYEVYTNRENGLGVDRAMLDDTAFRAAALKLFNEGFGLCLGWKRSSGSLADFRDQITDHIGAYCGPDRNSGLITLKLIRDDYTVADLPLFDEDSGLLSIEEDESSSALIAPSQLFVEYTDAVTGETRRARAVNQAIAQLQGGPSSETRSYPGIPTGDLAARVVQRDMRVMGSNLRKYKVKLDRRGSSIGPADAFRIRSLKRGIAEVVVRAGRIEDGTLANGAITITALQDVFGLPSASFVAVPPSGYVPPDRSPQAVSQRRLMEVPYRELAGLIDPANLALLDVTAAWLSTLAAKPSGLSLNYNLTTRPGVSGSFVDRGVADWCPTAQLVGAIPVSTAPTVATLTSGLDLDRVSLGQAALIDDEIVRVDAIDLGTGSVTLGRGCADTVPREHAAGARVWFYDTFEGVDETEYSSGVTVQARLLTNTSIGQLAPGLAGTDSLALVGRQGRPYPPGQFTIGGSSWPTSIEGDVVLGWAHRNRLSQADQLIDTSLGSIGPEAGTTYSCRLLRADTSAVLASQTGLAGTTATLATTYVGQVIAEVWSVRGGIESLQRQRWQFGHTNPPPP